MPEPSELSRLLHAWNVATAKRLADPTNPALLRAECDAEAAVYEYHLKQARAEFEARLRGRKT